MKAAQLKAKIELAKAELLRAQKAMDNALQHVDLAERADKVMVSTVLRSALACLETATRELRELQEAQGQPGNAIPVIAVGGRLLPPGFDARALQRALAE